MNFDIRKVPFSRYGSYLTVSYLNIKDIKEGLYLRSVHGGDNEPSSAFFIEMIQESKPVPFECIASPTMLRLEARQGFVELCISEEHLIRARGEGVGLRLSMKTGAYDSAVPAKVSSWEVNSYSEEIKFMLTPISGKLIMNAPWRDCRNEYIVADFIPDEKTGRFECAIEDFVTVYEERQFNDTFEECAEKVKKDFSAWLENTLPTEEKYKNARELAAYIMWSCVVPSKGNLSRPAVYMSKNWMTNIWSWDNCFNAMALVRNNPKLAWDQLMLFFDKQDKTGVIPDFLNDKYSYWNCCKPPIHGWALRWMMDRSEFFSREKLREIYGPLCRWTEWWFLYRDYDCDGIPQYNHGNDSGWDNSTVFRDGVPVESPDLSSFLVLQMDTLAVLADILDKTEEAGMWRKRAYETLKKMLKHFWCSNNFVALISGSHKFIESDSLQLFLPLVLGKRLPQMVIDSLIDGLKQKDKFLTDFGLATESISSKYYAPDGYWRGPIWAPSTMIIVDGLAAAGKKELARDIARRFCDMVAQGDIAENFNALTGEGQRDTAFTMTASVFLILSNEYCNLY
ncbi:hypothetical protein DXT63_15175 [Thermoanaerobacteraceae bacterium SP2]|jgi:glycogen debranching enzyme|nr:hypothetical protein DXT63_15175 [Thermoanaerobacteraceae bacterium SP2]